MEASELLSQCSTEQKQRQTGVVIWFDNSKGYGFIEPRDGGANIFCHQSAIIMKGYRTLLEGQPVEFDIDETSPKGPRAVKVVPQE